MCDDDTGPSDPQKPFKTFKERIDHVFCSSEGPHVILFMFPGFAVKDQPYMWLGQLNKYLSWIWWSWQRSSLESRFKNPSGLEDYVWISPLGLFINLHAWNHPGPVLSPKQLENCMEPHASSEILTRSDLSTWSNPKPRGSGPKKFLSCADHFYRGPVWPCFSGRFSKLVSWDWLKMHF